MEEKIIKIIFLIAIFPYTDCLTTVCPTKMKPRAYVFNL